MTNHIIAEATLTDLNAITHLLTVLFTQEADFEPQPEKQMHAVSDILRHPDKGHFLLIKHQSKVVGVVSLLYLTSTAMGGKVALLEDMVIDEQHRSKGFGSALLNAAVNFARQQGCLRMTLLTDADNAIAQKMYQDEGFTHSAMIPMRLILDT
nr:GNAT family N-acetyltransferase [uncultured Methylophaga sp.]